MFAKAVILGALLFLVPTALGSFQYLLSSSGGLPSGNLGHAPAAHNITTQRLSALTGEQGYTALSHPLYPNHRVRVKKTDFCDPTVK